MTVGVINLHVSRLSEITRAFVGFPYELDEVVLFYGIPIPDLQEMVQRRILAEINKRRHDPTVAKRTKDELKDNISLGLWDDLQYLTLEDLEFISQVSTESVKYWLVVNQVQRAFRRDTGWEWITIQAYSTFGEPGKNHVYDVLSVHGAKYVKAQTELNRWCKEQRAAHCAG